MDFWGGEKKKKKKKREKKSGPGFASYQARPPPRRVLGVYIPVVWVVVARNSEEKRAAPTPCWRKEKKNILFLFPFFLFFRFLLSTRRQIYPDWKKYRRISSLPLFGRSSSCPAPLKAPGAAASKGKAAFSVRLYSLD